MCQEMFKLDWHGPRESYDLYIIALPFVVTIQYNPDAPH